MDFRDILAFVVDPDGDDAAINAARRLTGRNGSARAFLMQADPEPAPTVKAYVRSEVWAEYAARAIEGQTNQEERLRSRLARLEPPVSVHAGFASLRQMRGRAEAEARCADISVAVRLNADSGRFGAVRRPLVEGALLGAGRPLLLVPEDWRDERLGRRIVIGWRDRREAARAVADAAPLLDTAEDIVIVSVGDGDFGQHVSAGDVSAHLARRGVKTRVEHRAHADEGESLLRACAEAKADLLVIGGYGRGAWRKMLLGGVTQAVLTSARLPVLMSH